MLIRLSKALGKMTYGPIRSNASGISSGLVRLRKDSLTDKDVDSVLVNYGCAGPKARRALKDAGILVLERGEGKDATYILALPQKKADPEAPSASDIAADAPREEFVGEGEPAVGDARGERLAPDALAEAEVPAEEPEAPAVSEGEAAPRRKPGDRGGRAPKPEGKRRRPKHMSAAARLEDDGAVEGTAQAGAEDTPAAAPHASAASRLAEEGAKPSTSAASGPVTEAPKPSTAPKPRRAKAQTAPKEAPAASSAGCAPEMPAAPAVPLEAESHAKANPLAFAQRLFARRKQTDALDVQPDAATAVAPAREPSSDKAVPQPSHEASGEARQAAKPKAGSKAKAAQKAPQPPRKAELAKKGTSAVVAEPAANEPKRLIKSGPRVLADVSREPRHTPEATEVRRQILDLDPRLWLNGWLLSFPDAFVLYGDKLRALSAALENKMQLGDGRLTSRELAYEVFADEKFLENDGDGRKLLERMGLRDIVNVRPQTKLSLLHHIPHRRAHMRLVISENLDPWVAIRALMYEEDRHLILGEHVDGVVFGSGYLIDDERRLSEFLHSLACDDIEVLYWGDIDRAGLQIYDRLRRIAEGKFALRPFVAAYAAMVRKAQARFADPLENEQTAQEGVSFDGLDEFVAELPEDVRDYVRVVITSKRLIPQEILTRYDL